MSTMLIRRAIAALALPGQGRTFESYPFGVRGSVAAGGL
jgi:hypothetical protein